MLARRQLLAARPVMRAAVAMHNARGYATPSGPPPASFRTSRQVMWPGDKDSTLDKLGKYFLLTEMARGMYVLLEQFFRPPYVFSQCLNKVAMINWTQLTRFDAATPSTTRSKRCASHRPDINDNRN